MAEVRSNSSVPSLSKPRLFSTSVAVGVAESEVDVEVSILDLSSNGFTTFVANNSSESSRWWSAFCLLLSKRNSDLGRLYAVSGVQTTDIAKVVIPDGWQLESSTRCKESLLSYEKEKLANRVAEAEGTSRVELWEESLLSHHHQGGRSGTNLHGYFAYVLLECDAKQIYVGSTGRLVERMKEHSMKRSSFFLIYFKRQSSQQAARYVEELLLLCLSQNMSDYSVSGGSDAVNPRNIKERVRAVHGLCCICGSGSHSMSACKRAVNRTDAPLPHQRLYTVAGFDTSLTYDQMAVSLDACIDALRCIAKGDSMHPSKAALASQLLSMYVNRVPLINRTKLLRDMCLACRMTSPLHATNTTQVYGTARWLISDMITAAIACVEALEKRAKGCAHYGEKFDLVSFLLRDDHALTQFHIAGPLKSLLEAAAEKPNQMRPQDDRPDGYKASKRYRATKLEAGKDLC